MSFTGLVLSKQCLLFLCSIQKRTMGIKERREREKLEMKEKILETATRQLEEFGYENLTIRSIAKEIEYSPRTIYLYFKDKDELLYAMSVKAFTLFAQRFESVLFIKDPFDRLEALNKVYFNFAFENPGYYDLMFILNDPMKSDFNEEGWDIGMKSHSILEDVVKDCIEVGYFRKADPKAMAFSIWAYVHGVVSLKIRDRMKMYPEEEREGLIARSTDLMHAMLKAT